MSANPPFQRKMYFFFGRDNPLSNWHQRDFVVNGVTFCCVEQLMMYAKAKLFGDEYAANSIMQTREPAEHKAWGRKVKGLAGGIWEPSDHALWDSKREHYVFVGALAKFSQNEDLGSFLVKTYDDILVEASRFDKIWGCGLSEDDPRIHDRKNWPGQNKLGPILEEVRFRIYRQRVDR